MQQVGARDDPDDLPLAYDRDAFDPTLFHQVHNFVQRGVFAHYHRLSGHQLANFARMTACILVCEPAWSSQELEPARSATLSSGLYAAKEVTFGEDTDETPVTVGNRQTTDTALQHYANGFEHRDIWLNCNHRRGHHIFGSHGCRS
jgi:hypothetical protein